MCAYSGHFCCSSTETCLFRWSKGHTPLPCLEATANCSWPRAYCLNRWASDSATSAKSSLCSSKGTRLTSKDSKTQNTTCYRLWVYGRRILLLKRRFLLSTPNFPSQLLAKWPASCLWRLADWLALEFQKWLSLFLRGWLVRVPAKWPLPLACSRIAPFPAQARFASPTPPRVSSAKSPCLQGAEPP